MVEEIEKTDEQEIIKKDTSKKEKYAKIFSGIFFIAIWVGLWIFASQTDISLKYPLIITIVLSILAVIIFFGSNIYRKIKESKKETEKEEKIPEPLSEEELKEKLKRVLTNEEYRDHIKEYKESISFEIGKNLIYYFKVVPLYSKRLAHIIINANYPKIKPTVFYDTKPSLYEIRKAINSKSKTPIDEPEIEKREIWNPLTQSFITETKRTPKPKKKPKLPQTQEEIT